MTELKNSRLSEPDIQDSHLPLNPDNALKKLNAFVGKWKTEGQTITAPSNETVKIEGTDIYEWLPGGFFLIHRVDVHMGDEETRSIEVIGYDASNQTYPMYSFDNKGNYDFLQANVQDRTWTITGESIRFTGVFSNDGNTIIGHWEMATDDSNWLPWMEIKLTRMEDLTAHPLDIGSTPRNMEKEEKPAHTDVEETKSVKEAADVKTAVGYASVNGLKMYYEIHGTGRPLILLHGGVGASEMFGPSIPALAENRQVIAVHLQAHGRTADIDRPLRCELMADDIAALMEYLGIKSADIVGYSLGAGVALQTAIIHPDLIHKLVVISAPVKRDGWYPEVLENMAQMGPETAKVMQQTQLYQFYPDTDWEALFTKLGDLLRQDYDWSKEVAAIRSPILIIFADADAIRTEHIMEFFALFGGGQQDTCMDGSGRPMAQLAILPGMTHYNVLSFPALATFIITFLDLPMPESR